MDNENTNKATRGIMERALQRPANTSQGGNEEEVDDGWGRLRGENSTARPFKTKGSWEFARQTLSCNNPVDPLRPLVVMVQHTGQLVKHGNSGLLKILGG